MFEELENTVIDGEIAAESAEELPPTILGYTPSG
jgi:hypothetical protein